MRRVEGEAEAVSAREEEETSASCSFRRSCCWVSAKRGMEVAVGGVIGAGLMGIVAVVSWFVDGGFDFNKDCFELDLKRM